MANPLGALTRLFRRGTESPVATALFANAVGQPLLVHPQMGEALIGAYMQGAVDARPATSQTVEIEPAQSDPISGERPARNIAVLNISGALVNRPVPGLCDPGPQSYAEIRGAFDRALADPTVEAIVLRMESPGGMAAGCFDLSDHIHASRGTKPVYAVADDYAYSAAFAIAAAADEVWVTRTAGVGSVGVIGYHIDQSGWEGKIGVKVTAVFAGAHKNDLSPHEPLGDDVRGWLQQRMDGLRLLFAESVASYRGMELAAVLATEAQVYSGADAVAAGFADKIGTFGDLIAHIAAGQPDDEAQEGAALPEGQERVEAAGDTVDGDAAVEGAAASDVEALRIVLDASDVTAELDALRAALEASAETPERRAALDRAAVTDAVMAADLPPDLTTALLKSGAKPDDVHGRIIDARAIADLCTAAGLRDTAPDYVQRGVDVETARAQLQAAVASPGPELVTTLPAQTTAQAHATRSEEIYGRRAVAAAGRST